MKTENRILISIAVVCIGFLLALLTGMYGYFIFSLLGFIFFVLSKKYGKEIYFLLLLPLFIIAVSLLGRFLILDYYNRDGLNPLRLHPFTITWLTAFFCEVMDGMFDKRHFQDKVFISGIGIIAIFTVVTLLSRGTSGMPLLIENYLAPISFFLYCYCHKTFDMDRLRNIAKIIIIAAVFIGITGIIEYTCQYNFLDKIYADIPFSWIESVSDGSYRIRTIVGHPLMNALYFLMIMILIQIVADNNAIKYAMLLFFPVVILLTGTRSIFLISLVLIFFNNKRIAGNKTGYLKNFIIAAVIIAVLLAITISTPFGETLLNRFSNSDESTDARIILIKYFINNMDSFIIRGLGGSDSVVILNGRNQQIIAENPWIILFLEVSYLAFLFPLFLFIVLRKIKNWFLVLIFLIALSGFNSFGVKGTCNYMVFYLISWCYAVQGKDYENAFK